MTSSIVRILALSLCLLGMVASPAAADDLADAKAVISKQVSALKKGSEAVVRPMFTQRLREKITAEVIQAAQKELGKMTIDDLVASVAPGSSKDSLKIKMKNGRTLTTLVKIDGQWLADTIWFK